jgi:predicted  nucleic acid-binding Zn-ribbon protein
MTISTTLEIEIKELKPWFEKETDHILKPLNEQGKKIIEKTRERLQDTREACEKLAEEAKKETEKGKATRKAKATVKLSKHFLKQLDNIVFPDKTSFSKLERLHKDLEKTVFSIMRDRSFWFPRISPLFIISRRRVDFALSRMTSPISELGNFLSTSYSRAKAVEEAFSEIDATMRLVESLDEYKGLEAGLKEKTQLIQKEIEEGEENVETIKGSAGFSELAEMSQRVQQLRRQVKHELRHLQKPFLKFVNLARSSNYSLPPEESGKLAQYLQDPFIAFATEEPGYPKLRGILRRLGQAMDEGKLKLKSSRLRKSREEVDAILNTDKLDSLYRDCVHAFSLNQQLSLSKETQIAKDRSLQLQERLRELRKQKDAVEARLREVEKEHKQILEKINEQKKMLENSVYKLLEKHITLKF